MKILQIHEIIVDTNPTAASKGISLRRSFTSIKTLPPVAWKKLPWGSESIFGVRPREAQ
jgi:hypothetical protein